MGAVVAPIAAPVIAMRADGACRVTAAAIAMRADGARRVATAARRSAMRRRVEGGGRPSGAAGPFGTHPPQVCGLGGVDLPLPEGPHPTRIKCKNIYRNRYRYG
jgi:hypothetical protein